MIPRSRRSRVGPTAGWCLGVLLVAAGCAGPAPVTAPEVTAPEVTAPPQETGSQTATPAAPATVAPPVDPSPVPVTPPAASEPAEPLPPAPAASPSPGWVLGARPLPRNADGSVPPQETPPALRDRRFPTLDLLPPPADGRFTATIGAVTDDVRQRMGTTWSPGCPVRLEELRYLTLGFWGFDDRAHTGEMVVNAAVAEQVVDIFRELFDARFPIEEMRLVTTADLEAAPTGDGNNTAAFVCRAARGSTRFSEHAYGLAIDVNPFQNPYVRGEVVLPELAGSYTDRALLRPGMLTAGHPAVTAFTRRGWEWGGAWRTVKDSMHFSARGG